MPRRRVPDLWPRPADSPLDRARHIAASYREAVLVADPVECARLDARATRLGQGWVVPQIATADLDDPLDTDALAAWCYVQPRTVDKWVSRGLPFKNTPDGRRFTLRDLLEWQVGQRVRRAEAKRSADGMTVVPSALR